MAGESLWSKGQKDAVMHLLRYADSRDPADFAAYRAAIAVPSATSRRVSNSKNVRISIVRSPWKACSSAAITPTTSPG